MNKENYKYQRYVSENELSRWADSEELKNSSTIKKIRVDGNNCNGCGLPVISDGCTTYVDDSDTHTMIFGSTGSKKTRLFGMPLINMFALAGESFIATDPKGELYQKTSGLVEKKGYNTIVLNLRDLRQSSLWNPLAIPYDLYHSGKEDEAISLLNDFINALSAPQRTKTKDIYFIELGYSMALAFLLFFIDTAKPYEVNMSNFSKFFTSYSSAEGTEEIADCMEEGSIASINLKGVLVNKEAKNTFANCAACVSVMLNPFIIQKTLCQMLSKSSFDVRNIGNEKTAVYIIVPDEKTTLHFIVTAFIKQTYEVLIHEAQQQRNLKLPVRLNFLLDEFCNIPAITDMPSMISAARSRNMRFFLMAQGLQQLQQKYEEDADTIKGNCDNWVFLTSREHELLNEISILCGEVIRRDPDNEKTTRPLISISELQRLSKVKGEALILHGRHYPYVSELPDIDDYAFKTYPPVLNNNRSLPSIIPYDPKQVIADIKDAKRPLPFSEEVYGSPKFYKAKTETKEVVFDW